VVFAVTRLIQKVRFARRGVLRMTSGEQQGRGAHQRMSMVLWDTFTGSATYWDIFLRTLHPFFLARLLCETTIGFLPFKRAGKKEEKDLKTNALGRLYKNGKEVKIAELGEGDFFGEMALFEHKVRMATVRSMGDTRVLTVDKKTLLHRVQEDPSMAFNIIQTTIGRIRKLDEQVSYMMATDRRNWTNRPVNK